MQRVRIGLTGLACVFLLVLLAASIFGFVRDDARQAAPARTAAAAKDAGDDTPKEPLAELGVAPGNAPQSDNASAPPAPRGRATPAR